MQKILVLVAGFSNLPFIKAAKELGFYVITCDNNKDNPGHQLADECMFIDVYDYQTIIQEISGKDISHVFSFVSAHGLLSAAKISEFFNLDGYTIASIEILTNKHTFRNFLLENKMNCPSFQCIGSIDEINFTTIEYPVIMKPTDSGGSQGVKKIYSSVELVHCFHESLSCSTEKKVIIEECIDSDVSINGDCFIVNGQLVASLIGDYIYDKETNEVLPIATVFPTTYNSESVLEQIVEIAHKLAIPNGIINFEAISKNNKLFIIEINPRPSGNYIWKLMGYRCNIDIPTLLLQSYTKDFSMPSLRSTQTYYSYQLIYSTTQRVFKGFDVPSLFVENVLEMMLFKQDECINGFTNIHDRIGLFLLEFTDDMQRKTYLDNLTYFKLQ